MHSLIWREDLNQYEREDVFEAAQQQIAALIEIDNYVSCGVSMDFVVSIVPHLAMVCIGNPFPFRMHRDSFCLTWVILWPIFSHR
jgi:hypothetical protein